MGVFKILIADDDAEMRMLVRFSLNTLGFSNVVEARNGEEALSILKGDRFDLVMSDWNMPIVSGVELLRNVRDLESYGGVPFLMLTCRREEDAVVEAIKLGANGYVVKPFSVATLEQQLRKLIPAQYFKD